MTCTTCRGVGHTSKRCPHLEHISKPTCPTTNVVRGLKRFANMASNNALKESVDTTFLVGARPSPEHCLGRHGYEDSGVYVLKLLQWFYVGKSTCIRQRIHDHRMGAGAVCAHGPFTRIKCMTLRQTDLESWERTETLARMRRHGLGNVRGWIYTTPELSEAQRDHAFAQICEKFDLCRKCGGDTHFATDCHSRERATWFTDMKTVEAPNGPKVPVMPKKPLKP